MPADLIASESLSDVADWALDVPLRILLIVIAAFVLGRVARRGVAIAVRRTASNSLQRRVAAAAAIAARDGKGHWTYIRE